MTAPRIVEEWREQAACVGELGKVFFPDEYVGRRPRGAPLDRYAYARPICAACPVEAECLAHALREREDDGFWGGTTPRDRDRIRKGLPPLPPPKEKRRVNDAAAKRRRYSRDPAYRAARSEYMREYRANAAGAIAAQKKRWADENRERVREQNRRAQAGYRNRQKGMA